MKIWDLNKDYSKRAEDDEEYLNGVHRYIIPANKPYKHAIRATNTQRHTDAGHIKCVRWSFSFQFDNVCLRVYLIWHKTTTTKTKLLNTRIYEEIRKSFKLDEEVEVEGAVLLCWYFMKMPGCCLIRIKKKRKE